ncbi:MAG: FecCD family ABC transporter permease [Candidatus Binatia bacterium]
MRAAYLTRRRAVAVTVALLVVLLVSLVVAAGIAPVPASVVRALGPGGASTTDYVIVVHTRIPRVLLAAIVGGALATAGAGFQGLLANPLADPHVLGISGGAAVTGAAVLVLGVDPVSPLVPLAAFLGALATMTGVVLVARTGGRTTPHALLLVGVVTNAIAAAVIMLVNAVASYRQAQGVLFWIMGALSTQSYALVAVVGAYALVGAVALLRHAAALNLLAAGEESAATLGVDVERVRRAVFVAAALLVGAAVSVSGMISFVGLIVPHLLRLALGPDLRLLVPASFLGGATFLVWADTVARTALGPAELPVGVITALLGGPFFLFLLRRSLRGGGR